MSESSPGSAMSLGPRAGGAAGLFTFRELARVGTATTLLVVVGSVIIIALTILFGHYNSLIHSGPKAVWDGAVIAVLIGARGRWRSLVLVGVVYGLVLLLQVGIAYLVLVMAVAGAAAAALGWLVGRFHHGAAILSAAACFELLAGFGAAVKIYFGTADGNEPILWALWLVEWPLRIGGAMLGAWLGLRWLKRRSGHPAMPESPSPSPPITADAGSEALPAHGHSSPAIRVRGVGPAGLRLAASLIACVVPLLIQNVWILGAVAAVYTGYALWAGLRRRILHVLLGLFWTWCVFSAASYLWHHDPHRVLDLLRTLLLRFMPLTLASLVLISTVRPVDLVRLLRRLRVTPLILIPLSNVARSIAPSRREFTSALARLKRQGVWRGPFSFLRRPRRITAALLGPMVHRWMRELAQ